MRDALRYHFASPSGPRSPFLETLPDRLINVHSEVETAPYRTLNDRIGDRTWKAVFQHPDYSHVVPVLSGAFGDWRLSFRLCPLWLKQPRETAKLTPSKHETATQLTCFFLPTLEQAKFQGQHRMMTRPLEVITAGAPSGFSTSSRRTCRIPFYDTLVAPSTCMLW